jgi:hypothetical protein
MRDKLGIFFDDFIKGNSDSLLKKNAVLISFWRITTPVKDSCI